MSRMFVNGKVSVDYNNKRLCDVARFTTAQGKLIGMQCFLQASAAAGSRCIHQLFRNMVTDRVQVMFRLDYS